jgi:hypothetical protein
LFGRVAGCSMTAQAEAHGKSRILEEE